MVAASSEFFALPIDVKQRCTPADPAINRGYAARGTEALSYSIGRDAPPDLFEAFNIGEDEVDYSDPFYAAQQRGAFAPNIWPQHPAGLRPALVGYFQSARRLALTLTEVFATALGLPADWFSPFVDRSTTTMRAIRYEHRDGDDDPLPGQQRMGAHTDYGIVTVLWAEAVAGLQIVASRRRVDRRDPRRRRVGHQPRRPHRAVDQRSVALDRASRGAAVGDGAGPQCAEARRSSSTATGMR